MDLDDDNRVMSLDRPLSPMPSRMMTIDPDQLAGRSYNGRPAAIDQENDGHFPAPQDASRSTRTRHSVSQPRPKRLSTSTKAGIPLNILPSAPASPPTPAPSPTPYQRAPSWNTAGENEDAFLRDAREHFSNLDASGRERFLAEFLNMCDSHLLSFVHHFVSPRLKKDPFEHLPDELCLRVLSYIDDPQSLARASQVSHRWHKLLNDDMLWKIMCDRHAWRRTSGASNDDVESLHLPQASQGPYVYNNRSPKRNLDGSIIGPSSSAPNLSLLNQDQDSASPRSKKRQSHYSHFRHKYMIEAAWRKGGESIIKHITPDQGVVTSLHLTDKYIVVAMDNAKIHVFNTVGEHQKTLKGHVMGVWAMVPWDDILVSGGCDRDVRVWDMSTGKSIHTLRGHTSTVRCLKMSDANTAISGSRDTTLRVWDLTTGMCKNVLVGHQASVRCLAIHGDLVVSGSYDTTARIWSISEGRCLRTLTGHFSQIYAIAFDGNRIATGSLDTSVRIWDPKTGMCTAILQGHTSLVGQLQMRGDTLVTGGSDGSVRVWSLQTNTPIHRLAAHDNSVTSLQFDDHRIVSGGSDGRVKIWSLETGQLVRELSQPAEAVWRVAFEEEKAVIMASRSNRTVMEVWSFSPPEEPWERRSESPLSLPERISAAAHDDKDDDERTAGRPEKQSSGDVDATMSDV
ncbi:hypothetical protein HRR83_004961 [Exophiala dermatitidis]|uniref:Mitochondrial division protein 1 n=2 Tax=Exophiala dermatitidis TaxID=5970 RepID=H6C3G4_EXODN|nr:F-box and WD-40 domain-containing protein CDC4 [Exophiala dermatitidis NIH/UT8656]KAJ4513877.1 hypothetical protein HRR75_004458 [Exophiala dermatitidis]EHY58179.1 F-box and WD-40 domain-containing protein CDC4 [Exophiala dermatitidis NIH/UT8656]KAJ4517124.1 hypothetical protein HRR74_004874 [Exophiala dermatitidis]KAJ4519698.1 hypothetical protein HRR73_003758 [Exophiala dermatitidis]KAJ4534500.1 hypothetical protein HRR76_006424 [Exophiala dermatitidis]